MSYIRASYPYVYVKGVSNDYVFCDGKHNYVEDYGRLSNESIVEMLSRLWKTEDKLFKEYLIKKIAERLDVKLRKKPLTFDGFWEEYDKEIKNIKEKEL
ncbi:hypothetical protein GOV05_03100 [Candidatus Woesearchaeota archaeon]|nr:hypothetical protein [Candidatus Woesearchaeota archaeon]